MPVFVWKGRTLAGEAQTGEIEVGRQEEALDILRKKKILITSMRPKTGGFKMPKIGGSGVSTKDLAIFTRQFESGSTLSDALGKHKDIFDDLFRNMVAAGEAGGILDEILMRLATYIEKADALK